MERSGFDGMVTSNQSLQALVEADRVEAENAVSASLSQMSWRRHCVVAVDDQLPLNTDQEHDGQPTDKPIMARRPFQISAWGVNPRFRS